MSANDNFDIILRRYDEIGARLTAGRRRRANTPRCRANAPNSSPLVGAIKAWRAKGKERVDLDALLADPALDAEMRAMARRSARRSPATSRRWSRRSASRCCPRTRRTRATSSWRCAPARAATRRRCSPATSSACTSNTPRPRAGRSDILSASEGTAGGYKEIVAEIAGRGAFARLKFESGVHRVQRVPATETQGRIHTSAATVAVLPEAQEIDFVINEADLKIDTMRSSGAGGQHVNKTESAIRITHLPTGVVVAVQEERSQHRNRAKAMALLRSRILDAENQRANDERAQERRAQVGSGDRSQRIRTYNFPQGRVTDHRINLTLYSLDRVMEGEGLDAIIDALTAERQAQLLAAAGDAMIARLPPFAPGQAIGLLGGSFNPPHEGHRLISELALRRLRLDRLWWLATPGNPLKSVGGPRRDAGAHRGGAAG